MSVAPEIAILAEAVLLVPAQDRHAKQVATSPVTLGTLARRLRMLAATPERWWELVRFDPDRSVRIEVEDQPEYGAWLVVLPPGHAGQDCDCDVATIIAGEATEGAPGSAVLRPGPTRVHGQGHLLRGRGAGYSISLHARAHRAAERQASQASHKTQTTERPPGESSARTSSTRNLEVIG
jgi:hypothetical protein